MRFIKKHKYKLLTLMLSIVSIFTLFLGINKTYAYETDQFSYTLQKNTILSLNDSTRVYENTINDINGIVYNGVGGTRYIYLTDTNNSNYNSYTLFINFYLLNSALDNFNTTYNSQFSISITNALGQILNSIRIYNTSKNNDGMYTAVVGIDNSTYANVNTIRLQVNMDLFFTNIDFVNPLEIGLPQYYETYYGQIEDNYNHLLSDYNDLQNNYDTLNSDYNTLLTNYNNLQSSYNNMQLAYNALESDYDTLQANYRTLNNNYNNLNTNYEQLESTYNTLQQNYNDLLESFNDLNSSIDSNIVSTLIGDNYFVKTNYQFVNTNSTTESFSNAYNNYRWGYVSGTNINGSTFNIGNALLESLSFTSMYTNAYNNSNFTYLDFSMFYNTPLVLEHYTATGIGNLNTQDNYAWTNGSLISCKYINIEISSSIDLLIQYRVLNQDGSNDSFIVSRDSTSQKYVISFDNDDNRVLTNLRIQCKYINNNWVTADSVVCDISNVGDDNYTLGYQNGYNVGLSENATNNEINNKKIADLMSQISSQHLAIVSLQEQISAFNSDYNLNNLMWTIASTPFDSFKQIWNVEFFGVNIASIVTGFLTGIIALWVLKKFFL